MEITEATQENMINDLLEQRNPLNEENEYYQSYSSTPNGSGLYHFVYLAAQLNFVEEMQIAEKKPESNTIRAIAIGGKQDGNWKLPVGGSPDLADTTAILVN